MSTRSNSTINGKPIDEVIFVAGSLQEIRENFHKFAHKVIDPKKQHVRITEKRGKCYECESETPLTGCRHLGQIFTANQFWDIDSRMILEEAKKGRKETMAQMINTTAPVIASIPYGTVEQGFARYEGGRIFFLTQHGKETLAFPVLKDGEVSEKGDGKDLRNNREIVDLVHPDDLGIKEVVWAD